MTDMFESSADFSGISEAPLKISEVLQKAFIEVDEEGSAAVAVTCEFKSLSNSQYSLYTYSKKKNLSGKFVVAYWIILLVARSTANFIPTRYQSGAIPKRMY